MGIIASIIAVVGEAVGDAVAAAAAAADAAAATAAASAGSAADAIAGGLQLIGSGAEAAGETANLLEEEDTVFDVRWGQGYSDQGAINDPWNWEDVDATPEQGRTRRGLYYIGGAAAGAAGIGAFVAGAAISKSPAGAAVLTAGQTIEQTAEATTDPQIGSALPDHVLSFMTPEEYEWACADLERRQASGDFQEITLEAAERQLVYLGSAVGAFPGRVRNTSALFNAATSGSSPPWFLPAADGQPVPYDPLEGLGIDLDRLREQVQGAVEEIAAEVGDAAVLEGGLMGGQRGPLSRGVREALLRTGRDLDAVYRRVAGAAGARREPARRAVEDAVRNALLHAVGNMGTAGAVVLTSLITAGTLQIAEFFGRGIPPEAVQISNEAAPNAPATIFVNGGLWRKRTEPYLVEQNGHIGTVNLSYYSPERGPLGPPGVPWFHFGPRNEEQRENLTLFLRNNFGGERTVDPIPIDGLFVLGDLVLQEAAYIRAKRRQRRDRRDERLKGRPRDTGPRPRAKRARRARN